MSKIDIRQVIHLTYRRDWKFIRQEDFARIASEEVPVTLGQSKHPSRTHRCPLTGDCYLGRLIVFRWARYPMWTYHPWWLKFQLWRMFRKRTIFPGTKVHISRSHSGQLLLAWVETAPRGAGRNAQEYRLPDPEEVRRELDELEQRIDDTL